MNVPVSTGHQPSATTTRNVSAYSYDREQAPLNAVEPAKQDTHMFTDFARFWFKKDQE